MTRENDTKLRFLVCISKGLLEHKHAILSHSGCFGVTGAVMRHLAWEASDTVWPFTEKLC